MVHLLVEMRNYAILADIDRIRRGITLAAA